MDLSSVEMSNATRSKHVFVALCMTQLECRRHGQEGEMANGVCKRANETKRKRTRRGFCGHLSELLGSSASAYAKAHRPASSNSVPRLALVTSHHLAAIDVRIEHKRRPRLEDLRFWQRRVPRPITNVHDSDV
jgi:hypothetical protein